MESGRHQNPKMSADSQLRLLNPHSISGGGGGRQFKAEEGGDSGEVSLFLVAGFDGGPYIAAIYEIKIGVGEGVSEIALVSPMVRAFAEDKRVYSPVGCDISGSHMFLMASFLEDKVNRYKQLQPLRFDTNTKECIKFPLPKATKPFPIVMAVHEKGIFVLAGGTTCSCIEIGSPCFERLDPNRGRWDDYSSLPEYRLDTKLPMVVSGYAVIKECILISVYDFVYEDTTEFYYYRVGSEMKDWQVVKKEKENGLYFPLFGKAEYVDGYVYTLGRNLRLIAYHVGRSAEHDGIIQSVGVPVHFAKLDFLDLPMRCGRSLSHGCLVHLGEKILCIMFTGFNLDPSNFQYVSILTVQISDDKKELSTLWSGLCALNIKNLGPASLTSLCFDSHRSKFPYMSEFFRTSGLKVQSKLFEELDVDTHMQPVNSDPPKPEPVPEGSKAAGKRVSQQELGPDLPLGECQEMPLKLADPVESVDGFLLQLGLEKYSIIFEYEEIDMAALIHLTDDDLKALGLPEGPRKKILFALELIKI